MNRSASMRCAAFAFAFASLTQACHAAGFQRAFAADPNGKPLEIGIWYPSKTPPRDLSLGPTTMSVAVGAPIEGNDLPLVVMSHGTGGSYLGHADTAIALADAGYVVAAVTHTGDNYADQSRSLDITDRPRQMQRVIDHMLSTWEGHAHIDAVRVGMFGFSAGGFTALANIGGVPDFSKIGPVCHDHPGDFGCSLVEKSTQAMPVPQFKNMQDKRIKAAVVAAPALGFTFSPDGLKNVTVPVQLWRAAEDTVLPQPRYAEAVRTALPVAPDYHVVPNAGHFDFLMPCSNALAAMVPQICTSAPGFDRAAFHREFDAAVVGFFDRTLKAN